MIFLAYLSKRAFLLATGTALDLLLAVSELHHSLGLADRREAYPR